MSLFKQTEQCRGILRAFICSSKDENCMLVYKHNTKAYTCLLRDKLMTEEQYRKIYDPHYRIGDKIYNGEISIESKEYLEDKERRITNFKKYGKLETDKLETANDNDLL
jgi:hypothetical protein